MLTSKARLVKPQKWAFSVHEIIGKIAPVVPARRDLLQGNWKRNLLQESESAMSRKIEMEYRCPQCGAAQKTQVYQSANVTLQPELKEQIFNLELFTVQCGDCGARLINDGNLLYHDMKQNVMLQLHPDSLRSEWAEVSGRDRDAMAGSVRVMGGESVKSKPTFRSCFGLMELREKIELFDRGLDDKVVELIKLIFLTQNMEEFADNPPPVYFIDQLENGDLVFSVFNESKMEELGQVRIPATMLQQDFAGLLTDQSATMAVTEPYVNMRKLWTIPAESPEK